MNRSFTHYLGPRVESSLEFQPIQHTVIERLIDKTSKNKASGIDNIDNEILKLAKPFISKPLAYLFDLIIKTAVYPTNWKISKVSPIHKKGDITNPGNFRPISLLSSTSKLFEKCLDTQIRAFLDENGILSKLQHGYRSGFSTKTALLSLTDLIYNMVSDNKYSLCTFLDLSKAFDTVDHKILLEKLSHYGIRGQANELLCSYLSERKQMVHNAGQCSSIKNVTIGVPQGSILGPLFYIIYVNDLDNALGACHSILYADDTSLTSCNTDIEIVKQAMQEDLEELFLWFSANKLKVNREKTQTILFGKKVMLQKVPQEQQYLMLENQKVSYQSEALYLGVTLDNQLSFKPHVDKLCKKISRNLGILSNIKHLLNTKIKKQVYSALILAHLDYCSSVWSCCSQGELNRLRVLLNRACRSILNIKDTKEHTQPMYTRLGWLTLPQKIEFGFAIDVYKLFHNIYNIEFELPPLVRDHHHYNIRNKNSFKLPDMRTDLERRQLKYKVPYFLNSLPTIISINFPLNIFKKSLKKYLLDKSRLVSNYLHN